jgi:hypothetical protein
MNSEQLKKVNELLERQHKIEAIRRIYLSCCNINYSMTYKQESKEITTVIDREFIENAIYAYFEKTEVQLKELGYED